MQRRRFSQLLVLAAPLGGLLACSPPIPEYWDWPEAQLLSAITAHFPRDYPVAGLLKASLAQPQLTLQPESNTLQALLQVAFSGPALGQVYQGRALLRFGLRFEPQDSSVRTHQVQVLQLQLEGAPEAVGQMFSAYGPYLAEKIFQNWALYQLDSSQRELLQRWAVEVGEIHVTEQGLRVYLHRRPDGA
ncbi:MAG: DUF1439 domain-containing protein [Comamonas sp.]|nr:DUF1439 domain-containing protein [Comamonas sp.]